MARIKHFPEGLLLKPRCEERPFVLISPQGAHEF